SRIFSPIVGPLFLSNPPWKLLQSSTPLLLQSDAVLNFLRLRALNLLRRPNFEYGLSPNPRLLNKDRASQFQKPTVIDGSSVDGRSVWESYFNLPNYISFSRMLSGPVIGWMILHDLYSSAFVGLAISGASDWLDGYAARKMKIDSVVGSYLDPLADKASCLFVTLVQVLIGCVVLAMVDKNLLHPGLIALIVARDAALLGGALYIRASNLNYWQWNSWRALIDLDGARAEKVNPLFISKVNTFFQLILIAGALLQPELGNAETQLYLDYLSLLVGFTTVGSTAAYGVQF
ncbi:hypothetical protein M569_12133, partial [Genlisea aurea]